MKYRFFSKILKQILGYGYPYFLKPDGKVVIIDPKIVKKEAEYNETPHPDIGAHICSGLQDKNGKDIYEEDLITWENNKGVVQFKSGCFIVEIPDNPKPILLCKIKQESREIIGNTVTTPPKKAPKTNKVSVEPDFAKMKIKTK